MMREYHQPYSEIEKIPLSEIGFFVSLLNMEKDYLKKEFEKQKDRLKR